MKTTLAQVALFSGLVALSFAGTACVQGPEEEESAGERDDAVVGGTATTMRPEIGQFINNQGGGCTATLIQSDVVLTASHCVGTPVTSGAVLVNHQPGLGNFYPASGKADAYGVWAFRTFSVPSGQFVWNTDSLVGPDDLALLWLVKPVPAAVATPAAIADHLPSAGQSVTVFGYGCDNRLTKGGTGVKRMRSFAYGATTQNNCWGDSGGPVVFGTTGPIFNVVSGLGLQDGADYFGDTVKWRAKILELLANGPVSAPSSGSGTVSNKHPR